MKAVIITGKTLNQVQPIEKVTKNGTQTFREFRYNGLYCNFFGEPVEDKEYEFVYVPRDANDETKGGVLRLNERRELQDITVKASKVVMREASVIPQSSLLALLKKPAKKAVVADTDEDED